MKKSRVLWLLLALFLFAGVAQAADFTVTTNTTLPAGTYTYGNVWVTNGATLTLQGNTTAGTGVVINATNVTVDSGASISADGQGYQGSFGNGIYDGGGYGTNYYSPIGGPGVGDACYGYGAQGAAHGGQGGTGSQCPLYSGGMNTNTYGSVTQPVELGSSGGYGGVGGGAIELVVSGTTTINGNLSANAAGLNSNNTGSTGAGGSIWIQTVTLAGTGTIAANGANGTAYPGAPVWGGGGGGRIAFYYTTNTFGGSIQDFGGTGGSSAGNGTAGSVYDGTLNLTETGIYVNTVSSSVFTCSSSYPGVLDFSKDTNLTQVSIAPGCNMTIINNMTVNGNFTMTDGIVNVQGNTTAGTGGVITANNITIDPGAKISADGLGYVGTLQSDGPGGGGPSQNCFGASTPGGGGHAGAGGIGGLDTGCPPAGTAGGTYDSATTPTMFGSAGGSWDSNGYTSVYNPGAPGGGAIKLVTKGTLTLNGTISANGATGNDDGCVGSGAGSGGSIWIEAGAISASSGSIQANGGNGGASHCGGVPGAGGGGGGYIAIYYGTASANLTSLLTVNGGVAGTADYLDGMTNGGPGSPGSIFTQSYTPTVYLACNSVLLQSGQSTLCTGTVGNTTVAGTTNTPTYTWAVTNSDGSTGGSVSNQAGGPTSATADISPTGAGGVKTVTLQACVADAFCASATATIIDANFTANITAPTQILQDVPTLIQVQASVDTGDTLTYAWSAPNTVFSSTTPTGINTNAANMTVSSGAGGNLTITLKVAMSSNPDAYQNFTVSVPVISATPAVSNVSCPASLYVGQSGQCTATISTINSNSMDVTNTWSVTNAADNSSGGTVSNATGEFSASATVLPTTSYGTKTATVTSCLTNYPSICGTGTATIAAEANNITATIAPPAQFGAGNPGIIQATASAAYGNITYAWSDNDGTVGTANPTGSNVTAASITITNSAISSTTVKLRASLVNDPTSYQNFTVSVPVAQESVTATVTCPATLYVGQSGQCTGAITSTNNLDVTNTWTMTNASGGIGGTVSNITGGLSPSAAVMPTTTYGGKTVDLHSCLTAYPTVCTDATATVQAEANNITAVIVAPAQFVVGVAGTVQATASAVNGALTYSWSDTGATTGAANPTGSNVTAATMTVTDRTDPSTTVDLRASLVNDPTTYQDFTVVVPTVMPTPTVTVTCPASLYVGQPGQCTGTVVSYNSMDVTNTWTVTNAGGNNTGGTVSGATGEFSVSATVTPTTTAVNKTVTLKSCLTSDAGICASGTATVQAMTNTITATLTAPAQFPVGATVIVQATASADYGNLIYAWTATNGYVTAANPTGDNVTAANIQAASAQSPTTTATLKVSLANDPTTYQNFAVTENIVELNPVFPSGAAITCNNTTIVEGGTVTCSVPAATVAMGTLQYTWYVGSTAIPSATGNSNVAIQMPDMQAGVRTIKLVANTVEYPSFSSSEMTNITVIDFGYTFTPSGYSTAYNVTTAANGTKTYAVSNGTTYKIIVTPSGQFTPSVSVSVNSGASQTYTAASKGLSVSVPIDTSTMNAFDTATISMQASSVEFPATIENYTQNIEMAPVPITKVAIASYNAKTDGTQTVTLSLTTPGNVAYNANTNGALYVQFVTGSTVYGGLNNPYADGQTYTIPVQTVGAVAMRAMLVYADPMASSKYFESGAVDFINYSDTMPTVTLSSKTAATGYIPYSIVISPKFTGVLTNMGSVQWQVSENAGAYVNIPGATSETGLAYTATDPGSYSFQLLVNHAINPADNETAGPISFTVNPTPPNITGVPFTTELYSNGTLLLEFVNSSGQVSSTGMGLITLSNEAVTATGSSWQYSDADTGELLATDVFKPQYTRSVSSLMGRNLQITVNAATTLGRFLTGSQTIALTNTPSVTGAVPVIAAVGSKFTFQATCTASPCLSNLSENLYEDEKLTGYSWTITDSSGNQVATGASASIAYVTYAYTPTTYNIGVSISTSAGRTITGSTSYTANFSAYMTADMTAPVAGTISAPSSSGYVGYPTTLTFALTNSKYAADMSSMQWSMSSDGGNTYNPVSGTTTSTLSVTPSVAGTYMYEVTTNNKYDAASTYTSAPYTLTASALADITTGTVQFTQLSSTKLRYAVSFTLATALKETVKSLSVTLTDPDGNTMATGTAGTGTLTLPEPIVRIYTLTITGTTSLGRNVNLTAQYNGTLPDPYSNVTSLSTVPFTITLISAPYNQPNLQYAVYESGINYYLVMKYGGSVKLYVDGALNTTNPPDAILVTFPSDGNHTLAYKLIASDGVTVVNEQDFTVAVQSVADVLNAELPNVTVTSTTTDPVNKVIQVTATLDNNLITLLNNSFVDKAGVVFGITVQNTTGSSALTSNVTLTNKVTGAVGLRIDGQGSYNVQFYVTFNGTTYTSPATTFNTTNVLADLQLFQITATQIMTNVQWGWASIAVTPQVAYNTVKQLSWDTVILDPSGNQLADEKTATKIAYQFPAPGTYTIQTNAYRTTDNSIYYTLNYPLTISEQVPVVTSMTASMVKLTGQNTGEWGLAATAAFHDPDSKTFTADWFVCGTDTHISSYKLQYVIADISNCANTYLVLNDGIGSPVYYYLNVYQLAVEGSDTSNTVGGM